MKTRFALAFRYLFREWIRPFAVIAAIVFPLKSAVADWNWVPTGSMRPTILEGELVFINKLAYDLKVPPRFSVNDLKGRVITLQERWQLGCGLEFAYD
jgi:signal peptidase I